MPLWISWTLGVASSNPLIMRAEMQQKVKGNKKSGSLEPKATRSINEVRRMN